MQILLNDFLKQEPILRDVEQLMQIQNILFQKIFFQNRSINYNIIKAL